MINKITIPAMTLFYSRLSLINLFLITGYPSHATSYLEDFSDLKLMEILEDQKELFQEDSILSDDELSQKAIRILNRYEDFLSQSPNNLNALILYGKFLLQVGERDQAIKIFFKANQIDPNIAFLKQAIGNYLVESTKPVDAFAFFLEATRLDPEEPLYHFNLGNFIYLFREELTHIEASEKLGFLMHESFKEATNLAPDNFDFHLRFAQSFFDFENTLHQEALNSWDQLIHVFGKRTTRELDYIKVCKARVLLAMKDYDEAIHQLSSVQSEALEAKKSLLLERAIQAKSGVTAKNVEQNKTL